MGREPLFPPTVGAGEGLRMAWRASWLRAMKSRKIVIVDRAS